MAVDINLRKESVYGIIRLVFLITCKAYMQFIVSDMVCWHTFVKPRVDSVNREKGLSASSRWDFALYDYWTSVENGETSQLQRRLFGEKHTK